MLTREEVKAIVDKVMNMTRADAVEVDISAGERSGTRWANSSITTNLVQYDRQVRVTVRLGQKSGTATTRDFSDQGLIAMANEALVDAQDATESPNLPELLGAQEYLPVDAALPDMMHLQSHASAAPDASTVTSLTVMVSRRPRASSVLATSRRRIKRPATPTPRGCSPTTATSKQGSASPAAWPMAAVRGGPAPRASRTSI